MQGFYKLRLSGLVQQGSLLRARIGVATIAKSLNTSVLVTLGDLFGPLLGVAHHLCHFAGRVPNRHAPDHQQVGTQYRIARSAVELLQSFGLQFLRIPVLIHA